MSNNDLKPHVSYEESIRRAFLMRGLIVPISFPLNRIEEKCLRRCDRYCLGEAGMVLKEKIYLVGLFCKGPTDVTETTKKEMLKVFERRI